MSRPSDSPFADSQLGDDESIRLLELQPGQRDTPISIRLLVCNLTSAPPYEALSYAWGDPNVTDAIQIKSPATDMGPKTQLHVTTSCAMALRRLRLAEATRTLWVDAICIDQSSVAERNHQMTLMTRIYHAASRVIVYLGEPAHNDDSDAVMDWVQDLHAPSDRIERLIRPKQAAFQSFLGRRWFTRVWVMQEIRVAKAAIVICGGKTISWDAFRQVKHTFSYSFRHAEPLPYTVQSLTSTETFGRHSWKPSYPVLLLRLLERTRDFDATDARDKLFAILPLLDWETQQCLKANPDGLPSCQMQSSVEIIRVDYSRSTAEMFTQLSRVLIDAIGLDVLQTAVTPAKIVGLPSWATDWSKKNMLLHQSSHAYAPDRFVDVAESRDCESLPRWCFSAYVCSDGLEGTELHVLGSLIGTIVKLGELCDVYENTFPLEQWKSLCDPVHVEESNHWFHLSPFMEALIPNFDDRIMGTRGFYMVLDQIQQFNSERLSGDGNLASAHGVPASLTGTPLTHKRVEEKQLRDTFHFLYPSLSAVGEEIFGSCHGRRFFITNKGLLGLAPKSTKPGDQVVGMEGATTPFVVRPVEGHSEVFELVGSCPSRALLKSVSEYKDMVIR